MKTISVKLCEPYVSRIIIRQFVVVFQFGVISSKSAPEYPYRFLFTSTPIVIKCSWYCPFPVVSHVDLVHVWILDNNWIGKCETWPWIDNFFMNAGQGKSIQWRHNERDGASNHQRFVGRLLNRLFRRGPKETSILRVTGFCAGNSPMTAEFPSQRDSNAENVSIWWRHHEEHMELEWGYFVKLFYLSSEKYMFCTKHIICTNWPGNWYSVRCYYVLFLNAKSELPSYEISQYMDH